jgi:hypothetical protein
MDRSLLKNVAGSFSVIRVRKATGTKNLFFREESLGQASPNDRSKTR